MGKQNRTLIIGWDAADWRFINPLIDRGVMPNLASFRDRSSWGNLSTIQPVLSPMLWTSIATGKRPSKHGVLGFVERNLSGDGVQPVGSATRRCKALWNIADDAELKSIVVGWYATHPAEPVRGCVVSNQFELPSGDAAEWPIPAGSVWPEPLADVLKPLRVHPHEISADALLPFAPNLGHIDVKSEHLVHSLRRLIAQTASIHAVSTYLLANEPWDLACLYYEGIDRFGHEFMQFHPPKMPGVSDEQFNIFQHVMTSCYRWFDMMLRRLLELAGDETNVLLISDHGYYHDVRRPRIDADPQTWHRSHGIAVAGGPGFRSGEKLMGATILDITPTVLALHGLPAGKDMDGRAWSEVLKNAPRPSIETWETGPQPERAAPSDPTASIEAMRQLVELGYVDANAVNGPQAAQRALQLQTYNLAISLLDEQRPNDAAIELNKLIADHPDDILLRSQLAIAHLSAGDIHAATAVAKKLKLIQPIPARVQLILGTLCLQTGQYAEAEQHFLAVSSAEAEHPDVHCRLGQVYLRCRRFDEAAKSFEACLRVDPDHPIALDGLAEAAIGQGDHESAVQHALAAIALVQNLPRAHFHLAQALSKLNRLDESVTAARVCLHIAPTHVECRRLLAELYESISRPDLAAMHRQML